MSWPHGFSWTRGHWAVSVVPEAVLHQKGMTGEYLPEHGMRGKEYIVYVHGGPFLFWENVGPVRTFYAGFRPTPTWPEGFGNEGEGVFGKLGRWLKRRNWGNLGFCLRWK